MCAAARGGAARADPRDLPAIMAGIAGTRGFRWHARRGPANVHWRAHLAANARRAPPPTLTGTFSASAARRKLASRSIAGRATNVLDGPLHALRHLGAAP